MCSRSWQSPSIVPGHSPPEMDRVLLPEAGVINDLLRIRSVAAEYRLLERPPVMATSPEVAGVGKNHPHGPRAAGGSRLSDDSRVILDAEAMGMPNESHPRELGMNNVLDAGD